MPTGYTAQIGSNKDYTFKEYAMHCARAFGALISMRDDPLNAKIPEKFEASTYHTEALNRAEERMRKFNKMSTKKRMAMFKRETEESKRSAKDSIVEKVILKRRYEAMLEKAKAFVSPSPEHNKYKDFMVSQIAESIDFDCNFDYSLQRLETERTYEEWLKEKKKSLLWDIEYHKKGHKEETERAEKNTKWVQDLRSALKAIEN